MEKRFLAMGALMGAVGVALGAFGAHVARGRLSDADFATFGTAVDYLLVHALALVALAAVAARPGVHRLVRVAGWVMAGGATLFALILLLIAFTELRLGRVAPLGGAAMIFGWLMVAVGALRSGPEDAAR